MKDLKDADLTSHLQACLAMLRNTRALAFKEFNKEGNAPQKLFHIFSIGKTVENMELVIERAIMEDHEFKEQLKKFEEQESRIIKPATIITPTKEAS